MTAPGRKSRWTPEQRAAKGRAPQRRGGRTDAPGDKPLNRKQRRALQFGGDAAAQQPQTERREERRDDRPRRDSWGSRDDRGGRDGRASRDDRREDRGRDDRRDDRRGGFSERRDDRPRRDSWGSRDDRPRRDSWGSRDDRRDNRGDDRRSSWGDRDGGFRRDDRPRRDSWGDRDNRDERRSSWGDRDGGFRRDDRPRRDAWGDRDDRRSRRDDRGPRPIHQRGESRRNFEPRGHEERRRPFNRDDRAGRDDRAPRTEEWNAEEADQMSWSETVVEGVEGEITSGFLELGVAEPLVRILASQGITEPFPIQAATIGDAIAGRDVLGRGRTGSGKTLAFGLPLLTRLAQGTPVGSPRAMILTPTRELALQIADNLSPLATAVGMHLTLIAGGMAYGPQIKAFERGVDIVVATPGRMIDLMEQGAADLSQVEVTVLDEADHMADLGFTKDVRTLLDATPEGGQRLLFSATLDEAVDKIVRDYLSDPVTHEVDSGQASVTTMHHRPLLVKPHHKNQVTAEIANRDGRTVLFARTQMGTDRIAGQLREAGVMAGALHGGLTQGARARILAAFREGTVPVLVATDVAARGIHVDDVTLVLQVDPPRDSKDYLHRAGRTARAGHEGVVATVVLPHQRRMAQRLLGQAGVKVDALEVEPGSDDLREATGARPTSGVEIPEADYLALIAPKQQPRKRHFDGGGRGRGRGGFGGRGRGGYRGDRY
ncbi:MAG TPA: DEAD/DEAH box helicase [Tessaracoccus flavescens]|uniref:DEAD/DEAH box helicase n=1 Tax=Tessaracoccus flavescens TaxID=399497 RepID=A0A921EQW2_9ACTN|nr:DEAD/DEAH box helicase [Tessaracoccus flavescens]